MRVAALLTLIVALAGCQSWEMGFEAYAPDFPATLATSSPLGSAPQAAPASGRAGHDPDPAVGLAAWEIDGLADPPASLARHRRATPFDGPTAARIAGWSPRR